jgi:hypothetical protein
MMVLTILSAVVGDVRGLIWLSTVGEHLEVVIRSCRVPIGLSIMSRSIGSITGQTGEPRTPLI